MTTAMPPIEREGMSLDDFLRESREQRFEIINGERVDKMSEFAGDANFIHFLYDALKDFLRINPLGAIRITTTFILPDTFNPQWVTGSRIPDIMFYNAETWNAFVETHEDLNEIPFAIISDFTIEVLSKNDDLVKAINKALLYLKDGVRLVWLVDPKAKHVLVFEQGQTQFRVLEGDVELLGGDVLPGFSVSLSELFAYKGTV